MGQILIYIYSLGCTKKLYNHNVMILLFYFNIILNHVEEFQIIVKHSPGRNHFTIWYTERNVMNFTETGLITHENLFIIMFDSMNHMKVSSYEQ